MMWFKRLSVEQKLILIFALILFFISVSGHTYLFLTKQGMYEQRR